MHNVRIAMWPLRLDRKKQSRGGAGAEDTDGNLVPKGEQAPDAGTVLPMQSIGWSQWITICTSIVSVPQKYFDLNNDALLLSLVPWSCISLPPFHYLLALLLPHSHLRWCSGGGGNPQPWKGNDHPPPFKLQYPSDSFMSPLYLPDLTPCRPSLSWLPWSVNRAPISNRWT